MGTNVGFFDDGSAGAGTTKVDLAKGKYHRLTCTAATRTVNFVAGVKPEPTGDVDVPVGGAAGLAIGDIVYVECRNSSGGALTLTWDATNVRGAPAAPANAQSKIFALMFDGTFLRHLIQDGAIV
jgi:hypothetical protein